MLHDLRFWTNQIGARTSILELGAGSVGPVETKVDGSRKKKYTLYFRFSTEFHDFFFGFYNSHLYRTTIAVFHDIWLVLANLGTDLRH